MRGKRVLVLGVSGFIGRPLALRLAKNNEVHGLGLFDAKAADELESHGVRVWSRDVLADGLEGVPGDYDCVFGLLAVTRAASDRAPQAAYAVNIDFVRRSVAHFAASGALIMGSTGSVYRPLESTLSEEAAIGPTDLYGVTKSCGDLIAAFEAAKLNLPLCIVRYFYPYGPGDRKLLPLLHALLSGREIGDDPTTRFNPLHISDAVELTVAAAQLCSVPPLVVNVGGEEVVTRRELAAGLADLLGVEPRFAAKPAKAPPGRVSDGVLQERLLPKPRVSLKEGLRELVSAELATEGATEND